jgi:hypothetical protein
MKNPKPKMRMFAYGNKNPGPGRDIAEKQAEERRKLYNCIHCGVSTALPPGPDCMDKLGHY